MGEKPDTLDTKVERALSLWVVLSRSFSAVARQVQLDIRGRGFTATEWAVMEYLYHKGRQPLAKVGEKILITSGSVTYVVDKLEERGLLRREPCREDRRVIYASLTDAGRQVIADEFPHHAERICQVMSALGADEQEQVKKLLKRLGLGAEGM